MKNLIIKLSLIIAVLCGAFNIYAAPASAAALNCNRTDLTAKEQIQCGACLAAGDSTCDPGGSSTTLTGTIKKVINVISVIAGAAAVLMIVVGGFRYITSAGNAEATKSARNTIVYAVIGLVIIALAQIIVHFVLHNVT